MKIAAPKVRKNKKVISILAILVLAGVILTVLIVRYFDVPAFTSPPAIPTLSGCGTFQYVSDAVTTSFIQTYEAGGTATLRVQVDCGAAINGGYVEDNTLTANHGVISNSSSFGASASPGWGPYTTTCHLKISGNRSAVASCGSNVGTFNLFDPSGDDTTKTYGQ